HLNAELIMRMPYEKRNKFWSNVSYQTYIKLKAPVDQARLDDEISRFYYDDQLKKDGKSFEAYKQAGQPTSLYTDAVADIHNFPKHGQSNFKTVTILLALAILLLLA